MYSNHSDFFCEECRYCTELWDRRKDEARYQCDKHNKRVGEHDPGCPEFDLMEGDEDDSWDSNTEM